MSNEKVYGITEKQKHRTKIYKSDGLHDLENLLLLNNMPAKIVLENYMNDI